MGHSQITTVVYDEQEQLASRQAQHHSRRAANQDQHHQVGSGNYGK